LRPAEDASLGHPLTLRLGVYCAQLQAAASPMSEKADIGEVT